MAAKIIVTFAFFTAIAQGAPQLSLEYKPIRPSYNPNPGSNTALTIPPGKPWPANPEDYNSFSQTTSGRPPFPVTTTTTTNLPSLDNRAPDVTTIKPPPCPSSFNGPQNFQSKPYPAPGQLIFPDDFWFFYAAANPFHQFSSQSPCSNLNNRVQENSDSTSFSNSLPSSNKQTTTTKPQVVLDYQVNRPFFRPNPTDLVGQIIPPGQPWPANVDDYDKFNQVTSPKPPNNNNNGPQQTLENRIDKITTNKPIQSTTNPIVLDYTPNRPSFHPNPTDLVGQIVPPGKPWPANPADYNSFSQSSNGSRTEALSSRIEEITKDNTSTLVFYPDGLNQGSSIGEIIPPGQPWPATSSQKENKLQIGGLYYPNNLNSGGTIGQIVPPGRPWPGQTNTTLRGNNSQSATVFYPDGLNQGNAVGQIVPPGKPWPANREEYDSFSQTTTQSLPLRNLTPISADSDQFTSESSSSTETPEINSNDDAVSSTTTEITSTRNFETAKPVTVPTLEVIPLMLFTSKTLMTSTPLPLSAQADNKEEEGNKNELSTSNKEETKKLISSTTAKNVEDDSSKETVNKTTNKVTAPINVTKEAIDGDNSWEDSSYSESYENSKELPIRFGPENCNSSDEDLVQ